MEDETDSFPWKVRVTYPWQLIEAARQSPTDRLSFFISLAKAAESRGGKADVDTLDQHTERKVDLYMEDYEFAEARQANSFVDEAKKLLDECATGLLRLAVDKQPDLVGRSYSVRAGRTLEGRIGSKMKETVG